jgi:hypothetical protein
MDVGFLKEVVSGGWWCPGKVTTDGARGGVAEQLGVESTQKQMTFASS